MAEIGARFSSGVLDARGRRARLRGALSGRTVVRTGAVALALLGGVVLVVHPSTRTRAEARFTVPIPLVVGDAVGVILTHAEGVTATAHGRRITVASSDASRVLARAGAEARARGGLNAARQRFISVETRRLELARGDREQAVAQLALLASHSGLSEPESAYRERVAVVQALERERAVAAAAGRPFAAIDAQLAENQQAVFELKLQVTRHAELVRAEAVAARRELVAVGEINEVTRVVSVDPIQVTDYSTGTTFGVASGVGALVIAGIVLLVGELRSRRAAGRRAAAAEQNGPAPTNERDDVALAVSEAAALESCGRSGSRYLEFYRALAPLPAGEVESVPRVVDLVHEEGVEETGDLDLRAERDRDRSGS